MIRQGLGWLLLVLLATGCKTVPVAGECPEVANLRCLTRKICSEDKKRGCITCTCETAWNSDRFQEDDRNRGRSPDGP